jgi:two-component system cell cycle response regulator
VKHGQNPHIAGDGHNSAANQPLADGTARRRLLIVEDSPTMRRVMRRFLDRTGYEIFEAGNGEEALAIAARERPDVILLDRQIPVVDGYGVLASVREDPDLEDVPVVLVTSHGEPEDVAEGLRRGAHDYLRKPFEQAELVARVQAAMRTKAVRDELRARNAELERLVSTDVLTGMLNHGAIVEHLEAVISRTRRHGVPLSVVLLDVEGLGAVNAAHGHAAGDAVLRAVSRRVRGVMREEDGCGRWSGDELLVVAPDTEADGVAALVDRLEAAAGAEPVPVESGDLAVAVSAGAATWAEGDDLEALVRRAEQALAGVQGRRGDAPPPG